MVVFNDVADLFKGFVVYADLFTTSEEGFAGSVPIEVPGRVAPGLAVTACFKGVDLPFLAVSAGSFGLTVALVNSGLAGVVVLAGSGFPTPRTPSAVFEFERPVVP